MEIQPQLPTFDSIMEVSKTFEIEVEAEGQKYIFLFVVNLEVNYDPFSNEIVIECTEERLDNLPEN
ncbi:MAG: hypothetical protein ABIB43_06835 [archaeon]